MESGVHTTRGIICVLLEGGTWGVSGNGRLEGPGLPRCRYCTGSISGGSGYCWHVHYGRA